MYFAKFGNEKGGSLNGISLKHDGSNICSTCGSSSIYVLSRTTGIATLALIGFSIVTDVSSFENLNKIWYNIGGHKTK